MPAYPFTLNTATTPPIEVYGVNISYEQILNSLGEYYYSIQKLFLEAGTHAQVSNPIEFTKYDSTGLQSSVVINPNIDPYSKQPSMIVALDDFKLLMEGRLEMGLTIQPEDWMRITFFTCRAYLAKCLDKYTDIPNAGNTDNLFDFWLTIKSNVDAIINLTLLNIGGFRGSFNSTSVFEANLAGANFNIPDVSIVMRSNGAAANSTYAAPVLTKSMQGVVDALNSLNVGIFWIEGTKIFSSNSLFTYDRINLGAVSSALPIWSTIDQTLSGQVARTTQVRHLCDYVRDPDGDTLDITFLNLPSFCTANVYPVLGIKGGGSLYVVDITVAPGIGDAGSYIITMQASDGVNLVSKNINLLVNANPHQIYNVRNALNVSLIDTGGLQSMGTLSVSTLSEQFQSNTYPSNGNISFSFGLGPGNMNPAATPTPVTSLGDFIHIRQTANSATGLGRYEDATVFIISINEV